MSGLYVHIPFCIRKCGYCDFLSFADHTAMQPYLRALTQEMALRAPLGAGRVFDTVFFGGGTPSILPPGAVSGLLAALRENFVLAPDAEITLESNPGTLTAEKLKEYRDAGVNRLSIGLQSGDDALLGRIGRIHTRADFLHSFTLARAAGFTECNVDIMYGLPSQTLSALAETVDMLCALGPAHISAYSLILEEGTPLYAAPDLPDEDETWAMHRYVIEELPRRGYARYEISNYARPGRACRHNLNYWDNGAYLGLGLGAHSAWHRPGWSRFANTADMQTYLDAQAAGSPALAYEEQIGRAEEMFECVMLGLRKTEGMAEADFQARFGVTLEDAYAPALRALGARGWLERKSGRIFLTDRGLDMQNEALLAFMTDIADTSL